MHRRLREAVERAFLVRPDRGDAAHVHDVAAVLEVRQHEARDAHEPADVRLDDRVLVLLLRLDERVAAEREAGVVDEDVDAAELLERALDEAAQLARSVTSSSSATSASIASTRRAPPATRTPASRSCLTVASPMPLDAPVTIALLPRSSTQATGRDLNGARSSAAAVPRARPAASCARGRSALSASARDFAARRGNRPPARRARARQAPGSRS